MKKEIAQQWSAALRSGKYKQGRGKLFDPTENSYCCLGVLCDILNITPTFVSTYKAEFDGNVGTLPESALKLSGVRSPKGVLTGHLVYSLTSANDHGGYDFSQIADLIDEHWQSL